MYNTLPVSKTIPEVHTLVPVFFKETSNYTEVIDLGGNTLVGAWCDNSLAGRNLTIRVYIDMSLEPNALNTYGVMTDGSSTSAVYSPFVPTLNPPSYAYIPFSPTLMSGARYIALVAGGAALTLNVKAYLSIRPI
jgi:hypothetical protein